MEDVEKLVKASMAEIERLLSTKSVVGDPMTIEGNTVIPLVNIGFGFGAGGGRGEKDSKGEGGGGTGGGGGIKPVAIIIVNSQGVKVEPIMGSMASAMEKAGEMFSKAIEKRWDKKKEE
ncbi:MAG: spore germination protein GerW family protein [Chloroflexota bacterium]|nr:spore germination protein GerW family protein [Chloroflexota bacterium]